MSGRWVSGTVALAVACTFTAAACGSESGSEESQPTIAELEQTPFPESMEGCEEPRPGTREDVDFLDVVCDDVVITVAEYPSESAAEEDNELATLTMTAIEVDGLPEGAACFRRADDDDDDAPFCSGQIGRYRVQGTAFTGGSSEDSVIRGFEWIEQAEE